ncbi:hypothetical protein CBM2595_A80783 [Cupriavidus taiwanensis]|nr:hypothetical protein CBM2595_A80783 [Cupriavidus taiwanensis]
MANVHDYGRVHRGHRVPVRDPPGGVDLRQRAPARGLALLPAHHRDRAAVLGRRLCRDLRRRPRHHGSGQQGRARRQVRQRRPEHRTAARAAGQSVPGHCHALPPLLHPQGHLRQELRRLYRDAGRLRHARRAGRGADAGADRQVALGACDHVRQPLLEGSARLVPLHAAADGPDRRARPGPDEDRRRAARSAGSGLRLLRAARRRQADSAKGRNVLPVRPAGGRPFRRPGRGGNACATRRGRAGAPRGTAAACAGQELLEWNLSVCQARCRRVAVQPPHAAALRACRGAARTGAPDDLPFYRPPGPVRARSRRGRRARIACQAVRARPGRGSGRRAGAGIRLGRRAGKQCADPAGTEPDQQPADRPGRQVAAEPAAPAELPAE